MSYQGYIYLCRNHRNGYTKIGFSIRPNYREKTLQSEEPEVEFIAVYPGDLTLERQLHERYAAKRLRGEWFNLSDEDERQIQFFLSMIKYEEEHAFEEMWHDPYDVCVEGSALIPFEVPNHFA